MDMMKNGFRRFWQEEDGLGTLEILLILAVLVIIAIAFRKWIMEWVKGLFSNVNTEVSKQTGDIGSDIGKLENLTP
ncbi:hypothetical protein N0M98_13315 [Paenibacillus doosanensis]|uniref:Flp1 family type IVb pilin n=1 Tax=Paenibacillus doosanensis TaxID=1229154 RepID=UPI00217FC649|nr:Flp1 family type IVb pilin [Paenibacillus doosanensis]MCS7461127.1 hypothetical protein [Paenibacillus doosanensis]